MKLSFTKLGKGNPIIIIHGLYGSKDNWHSIGKILSSSYSVYLIDQRNHGDSPHSENHDFNLMSDDVFQFINDHKLHKVTIIGHSMGGRTALFFSKKYSKRLNKLIIIDVSPFSSLNSAKTNEYIKLHAHIINSLLSLNVSYIKTRNEAEQYLKKYIESKNTRQFLLKNLIRKKDNTFNWKLNLIALKNNLREIFEGFNPCEEININIPTLFIKGEKSKYIEQDDIDLIKKSFSNYKIKEIKSAGHWVHAEQPKKLTQAILDFL